VNASAQFLNPSAAAEQLGVSAKALRLYEQRGLVTPRRTAAGWRAYGPDEITRAAEIIALRALGLSLAQIARVLRGDSQGLDSRGLEPALAAHEATQEALIAYLRRRGPGGRPLFLLTRSCAILDLAAVGADETFILCPANHNPPIRVAPYPAAPGYEAVATCLASPEVRARTEGVIAWRPHVA
jgi:DNA-binding transcriptional MerR regulator